jgi:hypothetical protein
MTDVDTIRTGKHGIQFCYFDHEGSNNLGAGLPYSECTIIIPFVFARKVSSTTVDSPRNDVCLQVRNFVIKQLTPENTFSGHL